MATAPPAPRWLLIENRAGWPRQALSSLQSATGMERALGDEVGRACRELGIRPVLIRRYGRYARADLPPAEPGVQGPDEQSGQLGRRWGLVDCRVGQRVVRWGQLAADEQLLDVLAGREVGTVSSEPVYLVCTHGRHDACCAVWGRPVAAALAAAYPERTWECSHIGGDRFAANVVTLPNGLFYGQVSPDRVVELVEQDAAGVVVPDLLRGSGVFIPPVQAAQHFARAAGHAPSVDNLLPRTVEELPGNRWRILLASTTGPITIELSAHFDTVNARLTCAGSSPTQIRRFELHHLTN
ncbi:sucrase ferredoxin [Kribbella hippodromi]|uniref:sucrase ferredoxin n=1 Tax=Kribbella hippodromi TaxID=434347 RepID=UPI0031DA8BC8